MATLKTKKPKPKAKAAQAKTPATVAKTDTVVEAAPVAVAPVVPAHVVPAPAAVVPAPAASKPPKLADTPKASGVNLDETMTAKVVSDDLKKGELLDLVAERSGVKRAEIKGVVEATMAILSEQLAEKRTVKLPELGVLKVVKSKETPGGPMVICRLKFPKNKPKVRDTSFDGDDAFG